MKRLKRPIYILVMLTFLVAAVGATEYRRQQRVCTQIDIAIKHDGAEAFISEREIRNLLKQSEASIIGLPLMALELKQLELKVQGNPYVKHANIHYDLEGKIHVAIQQSRPIARVVHATLPDAYVSATGKLLPLSKQHTARVMLVSGDLIPKLIQKDWEQDSLGKQFLSLAQHIEQDDFWRAQIAQMEIDKAGEVTLYPQVGKQTIKFGKPTQISEKFDKLELFYQQILPRKGWNHYNWVNLTYENQIVCD